MVTLERATESREERRWIRPVVVVAVLLTGLNLRPAVTSLGAVLDQVRTDLSMSGTMAGLITALPLVTFAVLGGFVPTIGRRIGEARLVLIATVALTVGLAGRAVASSTSTFVVGCLVAFAGIAVTNVLAPVLVRLHFPTRIGLLTSVYSAAVLIGVAAPAAVTIPMGNVTASGWRGGLGGWALLALVAVPPWLALSWRGRTPIGASPAGSLAANGLRSGSGGLLGSRTAWCLTAFFGLQSMHGFVMFGWLPTIFTDNGIDPATAAVLLGVNTGAGLPLTLIIPRAMERSTHRWPYVLGIVSVAACGYLGLILAPSALPWLWAVLLSTVHCAYPLAITLFAVRAREAAMVSRLSGFAQSGGYLLAAIGPLALGAMRDAVGGWTVALLVLLGCLALELATGWYAARPGHIEDEIATRASRSGGMTVGDDSVEAER